MPRRAAIVAAVVAGAAWILATMTGADDAALIVGVPQDRIQNVMGHDAVARVVSQRIIHTSSSLERSAQITVYPTTMAAKEAYESANRGWFISWGPIPERLGDGAYAAAPDVTPAFRIVNVEVRIFCGNRALDVARQLEEIIQSCPRAPEGQRELKLPELRFEHPEVAERNVYLPIRVWMNDDVDLTTRKPDEERQRSWVIHRRMKDTEPGRYVEDVWDATADHIPFHATIGIRLRDP